MHTQGKKRTIEILKKLKVKVKCDYYDIALDRSIHCVNNFDSMLEALKVAKFVIIKLFEKQAEQKSIDCEFGVSEWESFMPKEYYEIVEAIKSAEGGDHGQVL